MSLLICTRADAHDKGKKRHKTMKTFATAMALAITLGKLNLKELFSFGTAAISVFDGCRCLRGALGDNASKVQTYQDLLMVVKERVEWRRI